MNQRKKNFSQNKNWWHIFKTNFRIKDGIKNSYIEYAAPEREFGESKYDFFRLLKLSYKSFFALLSLKRLIVINIILISFDLFYSQFISPFSINFNYHGFSFDKYEFLFNS